MGKFREWCLETGETNSEWLNRDNKISTEAIKPKSHRLPKPYNVLTPDCETERVIQKRGFLIMGDVFPFTTRIEGAGKLITNKAGQGVMRGSSQAGMPDCIGVRKGTLYGIEFKRAGGHVSAIQYAKLLELHKAGAKVCICVDTSKIQEWVSIGTYTSRIDNWLEVL